ncbi:Hypp6949 [Branchiostoma lanceolatum]|uniref:Hypp6949 protein n=1 Tax=Branchiostoma lanceolatum TaxID=7740 RepID=A0A8K0E5Z4_BRALA|nr:Hypp6949 [Branchiostoma lanceolatum]
MGRETSGDGGTPEPETTKRYRTRSGNAKTKPWNTPARDIPEFETIVEDHTDANKSKVCSLKFRTSQDRVPVWIDASKAILDESCETQTGYKFTWKGPLLSVTEPTKSGDNKIVTIHFYQTGTILIHGNGSNWYAREVFPQVKEIVNNKSIDASRAQDGGHDNEEPVVDRTETIGTNPEHEAAAMTASDTSLDQTTTPQSIRSDLTLEKENPSEHTTSKSLKSPTIRRVLGGLENILLSHFSKVRDSTGKGKPQQTSRPRRALPIDDDKDKSPPSEKCSSAHETLYTSLVDEVNELKSVVFSNKVTMDNQAKCIDDLKANLQNRKKEVEKQARQIQDLTTELQHQRDISERLEALQAQVTLLSNQSANTTTSPVHGNPRQDVSRIDRLYAEVVSGQECFPPAMKLPASLGLEASVTAHTLPTTTPGDSTHPPTVPPTHATAGPDKKSPATQVPAAPRTPAPVAPGTGRTPASTTAQTRTTPANRTRTTSDTRTQVRILSDSLWNDVDHTRMFMHKSASITKSSTLQKAKENATMFPDDNTELVIIHVGSNDMDNTKNQPDSVNMCVEQTYKLIECAKTSYPTAKIAMSQVLPRGKNMLSNLNKNIAAYNSTIEKSCLEDNKLIYIRHRLLSEDRSLYKHDGIHLRPDAGVKLLVADVKRTLRHHQDSTRQHREAARGPNTQFHMQPSQHPPPFWKTPQNPPQMYPRDTARPLSRQENNWSRQPEWTSTQDKRRTVEQLVHMLTDFLKQ